MRRAKVYCLQINESRMALARFADDFETPGLRLNGFHTRSDFELLAQRLCVHMKRFQKFPASVSESTEAIHALISRSSLAEPCQELYRSHLADSLRAFH
ncbi:MAG: hypothetical protein ACKO2P_04965 [Planctomycetota bacterium]